MAQFVVLTCSCGYEEELWYLKVDHIEMYLPAEAST